MIELPWVAEARKHLGEREIKGTKHSSKILAWWRAIKRGGIKDDETPWCAAFVGGCLETAGIKSSRFESAKSYLKWGVPLAEARYGCVVVFEREGGGHVGFLVGTTPDGLLLILGGNQGDAVNIKSFFPDRAVGFRWPEGYPYPSEPAPVLASTHELSRREA